MSLKTEMLGLATIAELPLVVRERPARRPLDRACPTKSEQSDLFQAVFSAHGDAVRPVLAPTSVADTFAVTVDAFNIAEHYQTPVIVLSDQEIAQRKETVDPHRHLGDFAIVDRLRPPARGARALRALPLHRVRHQPDQPSRDARRATTWPRGSSTTRAGAPTASGEIHARMNEKRLRKLRAAQARRDLFESRGPATRRSRWCAGAASPAWRGRRSSGAARRVCGVQAARAEAPLPGRGRGLPGLLRLACRRGPRGRAVPPGPALPHAAHVRGRAARACAPWPAAAPTPSRRRRSSSPCAAGPRAAAPSVPRSCSRVE